MDDDLKGKRLRLSAEEVELINEFRGNDLENINGNTALEIHLKDRGIDKKDVISVKHWQSMSGELRFSIVTKEEFGLSEKQIFKKINNYIEEYSPAYAPIERKEGTHLLVINPADIHIGKYANELETGEEYNCEIAVDRVLEGIEGLLHKAKGFNIDKILFCIGNDILHIDNVYSTTTKGTYQDTDGKWWEHYEIGLKLYVKCVEMLRHIAPVDIVHSMSNHDYQSGFHLAHTLKSWFRKAEDVRFDISVAHRKYYVYGKNFIGLEHGDGAKMENLPLLMAQEHALIQPLEIPAGVLDRDIWVMLGLTVVLLVFSYGCTKNARYKITKANGVVLFLAFIAYEALLYFQTIQ